ncbi:hypothetical protein O9K51_07875 [Purpureocillium lavendulum]|uniref:Uncharacterized protein n=1 Tax=Purpureocillium lavendulum TaxID=1247861 RepID=A0AB34FML1_9HYPO|nr:hypothetical protein O9K51_07875 [Purpureocillium lavendulum]
MAAAPTSSQVRSAGERLGGMLWTSALAEGPSAANARVPGWRCQAAPLARDVSKASSRWEAAK